MFGFVASGREKENQIMTIQCEGVCLEYKSQACSTPSLHPGAVGPCQDLLASDTFLLSKFLNCGE